MKLGIQVASQYDEKHKKSGYKYILKYITDDGKLSSTSYLKLKSSILDSKSQEEARQKLEKELISFIKETQEEYGKDTKIEILHKIGNFLESGIKFSNMPNIQLRSKPHSDFIAAHIEILNNIDKAVEKKSAAINQNNTFVEQKNLSDFLAEIDEKKSLGEEILSKKIEKIDSKDIIIDAGLIVDIKRKRIGFTFSFYSNEEDLKKNKPFHCTDKIVHGNTDIGVIRCKNELEDNIRKFIKYNKNVTINIDPRQKQLLESVRSLFFEYKKNGVTNLLGKKQGFKLKSTKSKLLYFSKKRILKLINRDIDVYLSEIKNQDNVVVFTDGSINNKLKVGGSGAILLHDNKHQLYASTNDVCDTTYAEFKAIYLALKGIDEEKKYQGKKVIIVSDNDLMAFSIAEKMKDPYYSTNKRPYLAEIVEIIKRNNIDIHFHNVKSHIHDNIQENDKENLYDFFYNKVADIAAKYAAKNNIQRDEEQFFINAINNIVNTNSSKVETKNSKKLTNH